MQSSPNLERANSISSTNLSSYSLNRLTIPSPTNTFSGLLGMKKIQELYAKDIHSSMDSLNNVGPVIKPRGSNEYFPTRGNFLTTSKFDKSKTDGNESTNEALQPRNKYIRKLLNNFQTTFGTTFQDSLESLKVNDSSKQSHSQSSSVDKIKTKFHKIAEKELSPNPIERIDKKSPTPTVSKDDSYTVPEPKKEASRKKHLNLCFSFIFTKRRKLFHWANLITSTKSTIKFIKRRMASEFI